jgi:hypothetical protein
MTTKQPLKKILKGSLHIEDEDKHSHECMRKIKPYEKNRETLGE